MKTLSCKDVGMDCDWSATGKDEGEILAKAAEHGRTKHGMTTVPPDVLGKIRGAIRDQAA